jgi:serine/threonine-protein kinase HipA
MNAKVVIWNKTVGYLSWDENTRSYQFEFEKEFLKNNLDIAPLMMPLSNLIRGVTKYNFPELNRETFKGLPGMISDCLPDDFGNSVIDLWLKHHNRLSNSFTALERLCYTGKRGMGALEFEPSTVKELEKSEKIDIGHLLSLAQMVVDKHSEFYTDFSTETDKAVLEIIRVASSAGGAKAKAIIAFNPKTKEIRSGQVDAPEGFIHYIIKFDGVSKNKISLTDPSNEGKIEYTYNRMAKDCGINTNEFSFLNDANRFHFLSQRFDRTGNEKIHMQTLSAVAHFDFKSLIYSYENVFQVIRSLKLSHTEIEEMYKRMVFNVVARNQDDHVKNISFLMDKTGKWKLSPAYDINYAYDPVGRWTEKQQLSLNSKRDDFEFKDLVIVGQEQGIKNCKNIITKTVDIVSNWKIYAKDVNIDLNVIKAISNTHRLLNQNLSMPRVKNGKNL